MNQVRIIVDYLDHIFHIVDVMVTLWSMDLATVTTKLTDEKGISTNDPGLHVPVVRVVWWSPVTVNFVYKVYQRVQLKRIVGSWHVWL